MSLDPGRTDTHEGPYGRVIESRLRVLTWNVWWRFGPWEARQPAIKATLARVDPDILCLQEVWDDGITNQAADLAALLGFDHVFGTRLDLNGVKFGNAILSRWPIGEHEVRPLPSPRELDELRTVVRADIDGPRGPVQVFCTHLHWRFDHSDIRQAQVRAICEFVAESPSRRFPAVLAGDFNAPPDADEIRMLTGRTATPVPRLVFHDAWEVAGGDDPGHTWSNKNPYARVDLEPDRRIDYVFVGWPKAAGAGNVVAVQVVGQDAVAEVVPSDHYAVLAELRY